MPFKPGQSGNPKGRKPKTLATAAALRISIADALPEIINTLVGLAKSGDVAAAKILIDRVCPILKAQEPAIHLRVPGSLVADQGAEIIKATLSGRIPPDIGGQLITALASQAKIIEIGELTRRIEALENRP